MKVGQAHQLYFRWTFLHFFASLFCLSSCLLHGAWSPWIASILKWSVSISVEFWSSGFINLPFKICPNMFPNTLPQYTKFLLTTIWVPETHMTEWMHERVTTCLMKEIPCFSLCMCSEIGAVRWNGILWIVYNACWRRGRSHTWKSVWNHHRFTA